MLHSPWNHLPCDNHLAGILPILRAHSVEIEARGDAGRIPAHAGWMRDRLSQKIVDRQIAITSKQQIYSLPPYTRLHDVVFQRHRHGSIDKPEEPATPCPRIDAACGLVDDDAAD